MSKRQSVPYWAIFALVRRIAYLGLLIFLASEIF